MQPLATWLTICCCAAAAVAQYNGGPVQFGPTPTSVRSQQQPQQIRQPQPNIPASFQAPRFATPQFAPTPQSFRPSIEHDFQATPSRPAARPQQVAQSIPQFQTYNAAPAPKRPAASKNRGAPSKNLAALAAEFEEEEEEEEEAKPDRLQELLPQSKFNCNGKHTGYYADEGLSCEVFHYCQDGARHSWVCPDGFTFHQVHLICMPPSHDNICAQSSQFFFVNDYLYQPINAEEVARKPNTTLRYSDRYYPENDYPQNEQQQQQPAKQAPKQVQQAQAPRRPVAVARPTNQVFHSPQEVNIPLQQRRVPTSQQQQQAPARPQSYDTEEYDYDDFSYRQQQG
ncbi:uncharacterized protein LOC132197830 [Neocloeon triangulifer]|uniref:uncharacterized protein LOC132197830 n=1 Tax=Neocloeon triangulifer TaxID=2078957 RepID=UPI00286F9E9D|nr:uncharacterized protein LOC132197830 [Neocloeon triangulifer]